MGESSKLEARENEWEETGSTAQRVLKKSTNGEEWKGLIKISRLGFTLYSLPAGVHPGSMG